MHNSGFDINQTLFDNKDLRVYNKIAGVPLLKDRTGLPDMWEALKSGSEKPYLVHRLDKGTSGVLLVARNQAAQSEITRAFTHKQVHKYYLAWVVGQFPKGNTYHINLPICSGRKSRFRIAGDREHIVRNGHRYSIEQTRDGVDAYSKVRCLAHRDGKSLLLIKPTTGRTHQIRVHLSWLGHALLGDHLYGRDQSGEQQAPRLLLHCHRIVIPGWGNFVAPPPENFQLPEQ